MTNNYLRLQHRVHPMMEVECDPTIAIGVRRTRFVTSKNLSLCNLNNTILQYKALGSIIHNTRNNTIQRTQTTGIASYDKEHNTSSHLASRAAPRRGRG
jgi:hypothetical protein